MVDNNLNSTNEILNLLDFNNIPAHIAIIMDGNGRWADSRSFGKIRGHRAGMKSIKSIVKICSKIEVKYLTLYAFSTENWNRSEKEVNYLWKLLVEFLNKEEDSLKKNNVKISYIGNISKIPDFAKNKLKESVAYTSSSKGLVLNLALNYGARDEIVEAVKKIIKKKEYQKKAVDAQMIANNLYTKTMPDPDLLIRTSGEQRISNFLLWQISYSELYFTDVLWPDFRDVNLLEAVLNYQNRQRRFGGR